MPEPSARKLNLIRNCYEEMSKGGLGQMEAAV